MNPEYEIMNQLGCFEDVGKLINLFFFFLLLCSMSSLLTVCFYKDFLNFSRIKVVGNQTFQKFKSLVSKTIRYFHGKFCDLSFERRIFWIKSSILLYVSGKKLIFKMQVLHKRLGPKWRHQFLYYFLFLSRKISTLFLHFY